MTEMVNHPQHYNWGPIEVIDIIEGFELSYHIGNVIKYLLRAAHKGRALEDYKKAAWYLNRYVQYLEKSGNKKKKISVKRGKNAGTKKS